MTHNSNAREPCQAPGRFGGQVRPGLSLEDPAAELSTERARERVPGDVRSAGGRTFHGELRPEPE